MEDQKTTIRRANERTKNSLADASTSVRMLNCLYSDTTDMCAFAASRRELNDFDSVRIRTALDDAWSKLVDLSDTVDSVLYNWNRASTRIADMDCDEADEMYLWQWYNTETECRNAGVPPKLGHVIEHVILDTVNTYRPDLTWMEAKILITDAIWGYHGIR